MLDAPVVAAGTLRKTFTDAVRTLRDAGVASPETDARLLLCHALDIAREAFTATPGRALDAAERDRIGSLVARRQRREPVSRILGRREFYGLDFEIGPSTLDPRPDSETLIEAALDIAQRQGWRDRPVLRILDIGTGSGCLLLALLDALPAASGAGLDIEPDALAIARRNACTLGLSKRSRWIRSDYLERISETFDLIVSNPPYVARAGLGTLEPEVSRYDPRTALDGGPDGLSAYARIVPGLPLVMARDSVVLIEIDPGIEGAVRDLLTEAGLDAEAARPDLSGCARVIEARRANLMVDEKMLGIRA